MRTDPNVSSSGVAPDDFIACLDDARVAYFVVSAGSPHTILSANEYAAELLHLNLQDLEGRGLVDLLEFRGNLDDSGRSCEFWDRRRTTQGRIRLVPCGETRIAVLHEEKSSPADQASPILHASDLERSLRESEEQFRVLFEHAPIPMTLNAPDLTYVRVNPAFCKLLGFGPEELLGHTFRKITHPEDIEDNVKLDHRILKGEIQSAKMRKRYISKSGETIHVELYVGKIHDASGNFQYLVAQILDITARVQVEEEKQAAEQALAGSEAMFRQFFENGPIGCFIFQLDGTLRRCNHAFASMLDLEPNILLQRPLHDLVHPADWDDCSEFLALLSQEKLENAEMELRFIDGNGSPVYCVATIGIVPGGADHPRQYIAQILNNSERRGALQAVSKQKQSFETILSNMPFDVALLDLDFKYQFVNPSAIRDPETRAWIIGRSNADYCRKKGLPMEIAWQRDRALSRIIREKTTIKFEEVTRDKNGKELVYLRRLVPIFDSRGEVELILGTGTDITRITRHREELETRVAERTAELIGALEKERELGEMKMQFVSMASHEFRTPLATITTSCDILQHYRDRLTSEQIDKNLRTIQEELQLLTSLLEDFLSYGKAESGHMQFHPTHVGLHALLRDEVFARLTETNRARVHVRSVPGDFELRADRALFRQVLSNLIENALKYSPSGGIVRVIAVLTEDSVRIRVRDFGIGIPPEDLPGIFEPFIRGGNVGSRSGTGLGLAITRMALELHGGEIKARGKPGKGTIFEIRLPR